MFRNITILIACCCAIIINVASAQNQDNIKDLYTITLNVSQTEQPDQQQLLRQSMQRVLIQVSEVAGVVHNSKIITALQQPDNYVQQFAYKQKVGSASQKDLNFVVSFQNGKLNKLLEDSGFKPLSSKRPLILLWCAIDNQIDRSLIGENTHADVTKLLYKLSAERKLPIILPMMDLADLRTVSIADVWSLESKTLWRNADRYSADCVLSGKLTQLVDEWQATWMLLTHKDNVTWESKAPDLTELFNKMMDQAALKLAARYSVATSTPKQLQVLQIVVNGIGDLNDFVTAKNYLQHLEDIEDLEVAQVEAEQVVFLLRSKKDASDLRSLIDNDNTLSSENNNTYFLVRRENNIKT